MHKICTLFILLTTVACGPDYDSETYRTLTRQEKAKFEKYMILGKAVYTNNCSNCHMQDGLGLTGIMPPLRGSDFLHGNQATIPCLLKTGTKDTIIVLGKAYPPQMPAHKLTNLELAEVITFINNSWGNDYGFVNVKEVDSLLANCE